MAYINAHFKVITLALTLLMVASGVGTDQAQAQTAYKDRWGINNDFGIRPTRLYGPVAFDRAAEAGFGWQRYWLYWNNANPSPGENGFDWGPSDSEIDDAISRGVQVYINIMWAPNWAVQNTPGYHPWQCGTGPFISTNAGCEPRRPDVAAFRNFVSEAVRRYGDRVRYWGFWNEPNYLFFWHSRYNEQNPNGEDREKFIRNLKDLVDYMLIPGYEAAKSVNPNVMIVGPEVDGVDPLQIILGLENEYHSRFFDVISFHKYPPNNNINSMWCALDEFNAPNGPLQLYRGGRPVWLTETGASPELLYDILEGVDKRTWIDRYFYFGFKSLRCADSQNRNPPCDIEPTPLEQWLPPQETALIDGMNVRLRQFYAARSYLELADASLFPTQTPATFGNASPGYEVATQFSSSRNGVIKALRFYRAPGEVGNNTVNLWTDTGLLASGTFVDNGTGASGWQQVILGGGGVPITAVTRYRVSVNTRTAQSKTDLGIGSGITTGPLTAHQGFWGQPMGSMPLNASSSNFFVDVVFERGTRLFPTQIPASFANASPGFEVATQFSSSRNGTVKALRFYRAPGEVGDNTLRLWTDTGVLLASGTFVASTAATGWQQVILIGGGAPITAGTRYRVSVNTNTAQRKTECGIASGISNGPLTAHQGFWGQPMGSMPVNASCSNFFVDVVFDWDETATAILTCDNSYDMYFNGGYKGSGWNWFQARTYDLPIQTGKNVLAIKCNDAGGVAGLLAELKVEGQRMGSNATWKVSLTAPPNWADVSFDDSGWANATEYGAYGVGPWGTSVCGMPLDTPARWIWSSNNNAHDLVYIRVSFEGGNATPALAPGNLVATAISNTRVDITWTAPSGPVHHYELDRRQSASAPFVKIADIAPSTTSYTDQSLTGSVAYLYRVRAACSSGGPSQSSNIDLATTMSFTDNPLVAGVTIVKTQHLNELRVAVNAVRTTAGLPQASWTDASLPGVFVKAIHINELRQNLQEALQAMQLTIPSFTDQPLSPGLIVRAAHVEEVRQTVR